MEEPKTLQQAIIYFSDPDRVFDFAVKLRWIDGKITCPHCGFGEHRFVRTRRIWFCKRCKKQFSVKVGTIFEDSPLGLDKWMMAFWMMVNCKNGISSMEIHRALGVTQKSAWFMLHRLREAMKHRSIFKLGGPDAGPVEADESFFGGNPKNMHRNRRLKLGQIRGEQRRGDMYTGKTAVQGILDRELRQVRAKVMPNVKRESLQNEILKQVRYGSKVYTDQAVAYDKLGWRYVHDVVNHAEAYVKGQVHTNGLENFWSLLKRNLRGTYVSVEPFHLDRYLDEQVFRYNNRATKDNPIDDADRFYLAMSQISGRRLTYAELTGKGTDALHGSAAGTGQEEPF
jgi:transposase-like protein